MIISASRRTDIPAFYSEWLMNRIRAGYCLVPNPFNRSQVSRVSLEPENVDGIVFWTRNPRPLLSHLSELDDRGYRYYFLHTLMAYPRQIDPGSPPLDVAIEGFRKLSERIGPARVIWRYDPVFLSSITDQGFHERAYRQIAQALQGYTLRSVVSVTHMYRKIQRRLTGLVEQGIEILPHDRQNVSSLMGIFREHASMSGMELQSCADELGLQEYGIQPGKCIDDALISRVWGLDLQLGRDTCQRKSCGCVVSKDIGMYDSCLFGCLYCYATTSFERARVNHQRHDPQGLALLG